MNDSLEVEVLYRRVRLRRNPGLEENNSEPGDLDRTALSGSGPDRLLLGPWPKSEPSHVAPEAPRNTRLDPAPTDGLTRRILWRFRDTPRFGVF